MEDQNNPSLNASSSAEFRRRAAAEDTVAEDSQASPAPRRKKEVTTAGQFTGPLAPAQFKLPSDLVSSLKLHSINSGETMSELVLRCLTTDAIIEKAWISTRKAG